VTALMNRYDFVFLFDVTNGNPNGDPDGGNMPRLDPETGHGLVTDVCLKRKIRNYIELAKSGKTGFGIYIQQGSVLNEKHRDAYRASRPLDLSSESSRKLSPKSDDEADFVRRYMCDNFFDVRTFGAVMSTGINCGQVKGPVQLTFAQSVEPVIPLEISITRMAAATADERLKNPEEPDGDERRENRSMGRRHIVPYGLYRAHGFISAALSYRTGFSEEDLAVYWEAMLNMFEHDRSALRGEMSVRGLFVFKHRSALGNAPANALFDRVLVRRRVKSNVYSIGDDYLENVVPARRFADYEITIKRDGLPGSVAILECSDLAHSFVS
jgi:CRISPR-associated protein Csd2